MNARSHFVVVGVAAGQPRSVVAEAARFAETFDAELVCATVDSSRYILTDRPGGAGLATSIDSDLAEDAALVFDPDIEAEVAEILAGTGVRWSTRPLVVSARRSHRSGCGQPAAGRVVGDRRNRLSGWVYDVFYRQRRDCRDPQGAQIQSWDCCRTGYVDRDDHARWTRPLAWDDHLNLTGFADEELRTAFQIGDVRCVCRSS